MMFKLIHGAFVYHFNVYELMRLQTTCSITCRKLKQSSCLCHLSVWQCFRSVSYFCIINSSINNRQREWQRERKKWQRESERELYSTGTKPSVSCQQLQLLNGQTATNTLQIQQYAIKHTSTLAASLIKTALKCNNIIIDHFLNRQQITRAHTLIV